MEFINKENYNYDFILNKEIYSGELFLKIKNYFTKNISGYFSSEIFPKHKKKIRVFHNMFSQWYFWESYQKKYDSYPLILEPPFTNFTFRQVLGDYGKHKENIKEKIESFITSLNLENKFKLTREKLADFKGDKLVFKINNTDKFSILIKGYLDNYYIFFSKKKYQESVSKIGVEKTIALIFRYYVLSSNNNQLAVHPTFMSTLDAKAELFASGFNNYFDKFGSLFPDLEKGLGSIGRFQDLTLISGSYQINPPFQLTIIYNMLSKIKSTMENALKNNKKLSFEIFLPNWDNNGKDYEEYKVKKLIAEIPGTVELVTKNKENFPYYDYWKEIKRDITLPDSYFITIKN